MPDSLACPGSGHEACGNSTKPTKTLAVPGGLIFGTAALADGMTHDQYEAAEDVCEAEAKGTERIAKADLKARHEPTARNVQKARDARVEATYSVARERGARQ